MIKMTRSKCTECQICMEICSWIHFEENTTKRSRIWVEADWPEMPTLRVCLACRDHDCIQACPNGALAWDNWIQVDKDLCDFLWNVCGSVFCQRNPNGSHDPSSARLRYLRGRVSMCSMVSDSGHREDQRIMKKWHGYAGKILDVDLSIGAINPQPLDEALARDTWEEKGLVQKYFSISCPAMRPFVSSKYIGICHGPFDGDISPFQWSL